MREVDRPVPEKTKQQIDAKLAGMGEYVQMSYLQRALKSGLDFETKRYVLLKLATIYEMKFMYSECGRAMKLAAEITTTYRDKIKEYMKSIEMFIRGSDYQEADILFAQALSLGNERERAEMKTALKFYYLTQAKEFIKTDKRSQARIVCEKMLTLDLDAGEKRLVQQQLLDLYQKLGNVREYMNLKRVVG